MADADGGEVAQTVSDHIIQRLYTWGVRTIYGYPGDGINGLIGALNRADGRIRFIQTRHEEIAAFMACGHAKYTGEVGVCMATSGPGAIHLLNGILHGDPHRWRMIEQSAKQVWAKLDAR